jgi:hypothetical protein
MIGVWIAVGAGNFSVPHSVQTCLLSNGYWRDVFPWGKSGRSVKLTTHLHLVQRSKNVWSYTSTPQYVFMACWTIGWSGFESRGGDWKFLCSTPRPDRLWYSLSLLSNGYCGLFPLVKAAGAWSWPLIFILCRGQRMCGAIPPLPLYDFMVWFIFKQRDNFTLFT